jgi:hypothetical protein
VASLNVRPVFASNELLSVLASLCQTPNAVFALRRLGKRREPEGGAIPNCILEFPQTHINARFLSHIDNFGSPPYAMIDIILYSIKSRAIFGPGLWCLKILPRLNATYRNTIFSSQMNGIDNDHSGMKGLWGFPPRIVILEPLCERIEKAPPPS